MLSIEKQLLFLLSRTESMESSELIRIYENRGYSAAYIRNGLSRLKKEGYALNPSRSTYQITATGRAFIQSINQKPQLYEQMWDRTWHLVMLEIPESERKKRDQFRADILQTGFGLLYNSVYISPWSYREEVQRLVDKYDLQEHVTLFQGAITDKPLTSNKARAIWQLDQVADTYRAKMAWFHEEFKPRFNPMLQQPSEVLDIFIGYLHLGEIISELYLVDPMLPEELLPQEWEGRRSLYALLDYLEKLAQAVPANSAYAQFIR